MNIFTSAFVLSTGFGLSPGYRRTHFISIIQFYPNRFNLSLDYISENRSGDKSNPELNKNVELNQYFPSTGDKLNPELNENVELNQYRTHFISIIQFYSNRFNLSLDYISENRSGDKSNPELNKNVELNQYFPSTGDKLNPELNDNVELNQYLTSTGDKLNPELNENVELNQYFA